MILKFLAIQALLTAGPADPPSSRPAAAEYDGSAGQLEVATPRIIDPDIDIDGRLDEAVWADAALLHSFTQYDPVESVPASQRTEVLIFVSDDAIYFGIQAYDDDPGGIRASITERDGFRPLRRLRTPGHRYVQ